MASSSVEEMPEGSVLTGPEQYAPGASYQASQTERIARQDRIREELPDYLGSFSAFQERFAALLQGLTPADQQEHYQKAIASARKRAGEVVH